MALTPAAIANKRFTPVRLREGYDMGEVDQFLDAAERSVALLLDDNRRLAASGQAGIASPALQNVLQPSAVDSVRFTPTRMREGYDMGEVDQFLDELESELRVLGERNRQLRTTSAAGPSYAPPPTAPPSPHHGLVPLELPNESHSR